MSLYSFFIQIFGCLVCAKNWSRCLFYSLIYISKIQPSCTYPSMELTLQEKREEEDGDRHLFRSNFSHINQNIKIIVKSFCHKIRRHWKQLGTSQVALVIENLPASTGDTEEAGLISRLGRCPGGGNGNSLIFLTGKYHFQSRKILAEDPGRLQSMGLQRVGCNSASTQASMHEEDLMPEFPLQQLLQ